VLTSLRRDQYAISIPEEISTKAKGALDRMLQYLSPVRG